jgi:hypothetical protein
MLVAGLVILFPVVNNRGSMRVCGKFVKFSSSLMRVVWHSDPHTRGLLHSRLLPLLGLSHKGHLEEYVLPLTTDERVTRGSSSSTLRMSFSLKMRGGNTLQRSLALPNVFAARAGDRFGRKFLFHLSLTHWTISAPHIHCLSWLNRKPSLDCFGGLREVNLTHVISCLLTSFCPIVD